MTLQKHTFEETNIKHCIIHHLRMQYDSADLDNFFFEGRSDKIDLNFITNI